MKKTIITMMVIIIIFIFGGIVVYQINQEEIKDTTCHITYQTEEGFQSQEVQSKYKQWTLSLESFDFYYNPPLGYQFEKLYMEDSYIEEASMEDCKDGKTLYLKSVIKDSQLDIVILTSEDLVIKETFISEYDNAYITTNGSIYIQYNVRSTDTTILVNVEPFLNLHENEEVIDIQYSLGNILYLTSEYRLLVQSESNLGMEGVTDFEAFSMIDETMFKDYSVKKVVRDHNNLFIFTSEKEILHFTSDGFNLYEVAGFHEQLENFIDLKEIEDIYYSGYLNAHLLIKDTDGQLYQVYMYQTTIFSVSKFKTYKDVSEDDIVSQIGSFESDDIIIDNEIYNAGSIGWIHWTQRPDNMLNDTETVLGFERISDEYYYLTDEHLYYFENSIYSYDTELTDFRSFDGEEYINMTSLIPLEETETIIDFSLESTATNSISIYILTSEGRLLISEPLTKEGEEVRFSNEIVFEDLKDFYHLDETDYFIEMYSVYNGIRLLTNEGVIIIHSISNELYDTVILPQSVRYYSDTITIDTDIEATLASHIDINDIEGYYKDPLYQEAYSDYSIFTGKDTLVYVTLK